MSTAYRRRWREIAIGRWCLMHYPRAIETAWLVCCGETVIFSAQSLGELLAAVLSRVCRAF
jgi:hypothetical protein